MSQPICPTGPADRKRTREETRERTTAVYLVYTINAGSRGAPHYTEIYRIPSDAMEGHILDVLERWNCAFEGSSNKEEADTAKSLARYLDKRMQKFALGAEGLRPGDSVKRPKDVVLDIFNIWLEG